MPNKLLQRAALGRLRGVRVKSPRPLRSTPLVSVVVPCYNYGHFLPRCLDSILEQPGVEVDVIVVDDASPDGSADVAAAIADSDPRVRLIRHQVNQGHIQTYNTGLAQVRGDYVVLLSADDALTPGALSRAVAVMEAEPEVGFVYGYAPNFTEWPPPPARQAVGTWTIWRGHSWFDWRCSTGSNPIKCPEVVMRATLAERIGGYRPDLPHSGDYEMWLRAAACADVAVLGGVDQAYYRLHGQNMSRVHYASNLTNLVERRRALEAALDTHGHLLPAPDRTRVEALKVLARHSLQHALDDLVSRGATPDVQSIADYRAFAVDCWPGVRATRDWKLLGRLESQSPPLLRGRGRGLRDTLLAKVRWRRQRWAGV